jgi:hypothetical protein
MATAVPFVLLLPNTPGMRHFFVVYSLSLPVTIAQLNSSASVIPAVSLSKFRAANRVETVCRQTELLRYETKTPFFYFHVSSCYFYFTQCPFYYNQSPNPSPGK